MSVIFPGIRTLNVLHFKCLKLLLTSSTTTLIHHMRGISYYDYEFRKRRVHKFKFSPVKNEISLLSNENPSAFSNSFSTLVDERDFTNEIDIILSLPESKIKQLGIANSTELNRCLKDLEKYKDYLTRGDVDRLILLTQQTVEWDFRQSSNLVEKIWKFIFSCEQFSFTSENLMSYIETSTISQNKLSVNAVLEIAEKHKIDFNRDHCELLMACAALFGSTDDSLVLLSYMKEAHFAANENIFSSLIRLHGVNKDKENILNVLSAIQNSKVEMSTNVVISLVVAFLQCDDMDEATLYVDQLKNQKSNLTSKQYCEILMSLASNGHFKKNRTFFDYILDSKIALCGNIDLRKLILQLINLHYCVEASYILVKQIVKRRPHFMNSCSIYIKELVRARNDNTQVLDTCKFLIDNEINSFAYYVALEASLLDHRNQLSWSILRAIKKEGGSIRDHYFWPLLAVEYENDDHAAKVLRCLDGMLELDTKPSFETLSTYIIPKLPVESPDVVISMLKDKGFTEIQISAPLLAVIMSKSYTDALNFVKSHDMIFDSTMIIPALASSFESSPNETVEILSHLIEGRSLDSHRNVKRDIISKKDFGGMFLIKLFNIERLFDEQFSNVIDAFLSRGIHISCSAQTFLSNALPMNTDLEKKLNSLVDDHLEASFEDHIPHPNNMSIEELEAHLIELRMNSKNTRGILRKLILAHSASKNLKRVEELMKEISLVDGEMSAGLLSAKLKAEISAGDVDKALEIYLNLLFKFPKFSIDSWKIFDLSKLLIENGRTQEGLKILREHTESRNEGRIDKRGILHNCHALMMSTASRGDYNSTWEIFSALRKAKMIDYSRVTLGPLVKAKLMSGDIHGAVAEVEKWSSSVRQLPLRIEVMMAIMKSADLCNGLETVDDQGTSYKILLERMIKLTSKFYGPSHANLDLLSSSLDAHLEAEAEKIFSYVENRINLDNLDRLCQRYVKIKEVVPLKILLNVSRGSNKIDRSKISEYMLRIYCIRRNGVEALALWRHMVDEDIIPTNSFMTGLSKLLDQCRIEKPIEFKDKEVQGAS